MIVRSRRADLAWLADAAAAGTIRAVVDRVYPFSEVADAHAYLETKRARGKVILVP